MVCKWLPSYLLCLVLCGWSLLRPESWCSCRSCRSRVPRCPCRWSSFARMWLVAPFVCCELHSGYEWSDAWTDPQGFLRCVSKKPQHIKFKDNKPNMVKPPWIFYYYYLNFKQTNNRLDKQTNSKKKKKFMISCLSYSSTIIKLKFCIYAHNLAQ